MKKTLIATCASVLATSTGFISAAPALAATNSGVIYEDNEANYGNVVVLVKFAEDTNENYNKELAEAYKANGIPTEWKRFERTLNETDPKAYIKGSVKEYIDYASGGKKSIYNYLPQTNSDWTVKYITLGNYSNYIYDDNKLINEAIDKFNKEFNFDGKLADKNNDGIADCVSFIVEVPDGWKGANYISHYSTAANKDVVNKKIGNTNPVTIDKFISVGTISIDLGSGTFAHELQHALGARDYYRNGVGDEGGNATGNQQPVGVWDIMAASGVRSTPLAITRQDCSFGNIDFETLPVYGESKEITLSTLTEVNKDPSKRQAVAFKTPKNDSEYFVVEYREQGKKYTSDYDIRIPNSGIIVYRVNPAYFEEGNYLGNDYVYIFRTGERGLKDSYSPDLYVPAALSKTGVNTFGSTEMTKTITDNAYVYSDGSNSGIKINVIENGNGQAKFSIETADYSSMKFWNTSKNEDATTPFDKIEGSTTDIATDSNNIYMLAGSGAISDSLTVAKWDGGQWTTLGQLPGKISMPSIAVVAGKVYVGGVDSSSKYVIYERSADASSNWSKTVTLDKANVSQASLGQVEGKLYAAIVANSDKTAYTYEITGNSAKQIGSEITGQLLQKPSIVSINGKVGIVISDFFARPSWTKLFQLEGNTFKQIYETSMITGSVSEVTSGDTSYVMCSTNAAGDPSLMIINNGAVTQKKIPALNKYTNKGNIAINGEEIYYVVNEGNKVKVLKANLSNLDSWEQVGEAVVSPADSGKLAFVGNKVYVATATSNKPYLKELAVKEEAVIPVVEKATYKVEYYQQQLDGSYKLTDTVNKEAVEVGTNVESEGKEYAHYHENETHAERLVSGQVVKGDALTLKRYYDLDTNKVTYKSSESTIKLDGSDYSEADVKYGASIKVPAGKEVEGYTFTGWTLKGEAVKVGQDLTVTEAIELVANYSKNPDMARYKVEYYQQQLDGSYKLKDTVNKEAVEVGTSVESESKEYAHYHENKTHAERLVSGQVVKGDALTLKRYYDLDTNKVTYKSSESTIKLDGSDYAEADVKYGASIKVPAGKEVEGYTFTGWTLKGEVVKVGQDLTVTEATELVANYIKKEVPVIPEEVETVTYTCEYYLEQIDGSYKKEVENKEAKVGEKVTIAEKEYANYSEDTSNKSRLVETNLKPSDLGNETLKRFYKLNTNKVIYKSSESTIKLDGSDYAEADVKYGASIKVPAGKEVEGYTFAGWTLKGEEVSVGQNITITEATELVANYSKNPDTSEVPKEDKLVDDAGKVIADDYKGLAWINKELTYINNGQVDTSYTGLTRIDNKGTWYYVNKGKYDNKYTGLARIDNKGTWYYVAKGKYTPSYTGLCKYGSKYYYVKKGKVDFKYTGLARIDNKGTWYYVNKGKYDNKYTGLARIDNKGTWYYVNKGKYDNKYTGLARIDNKGTWYYVAKGKYTPSYTGLCKYGSKYYYVKKGKVDFKYTGIIRFNGRLYVIKSGVKLI